MSNFFLGGFGNALGLYGSSQRVAFQRQMQNSQDAQTYQAWSQQLMNQYNGPGSFVQVASGTLTGDKPINTCAFCGRQTNDPDFEYGCRGCGALEWR